MNLGLKGKKALVTGASSGLGLGAAKALAAEGAKVLIASRSQAKLKTAVNVIGNGARYTIADLSNPRNATALVDEAVNLLGGLDILICNSGGPLPGGFYDKDLSDYRSALDANLLASIELARGSVPYMENAGWGRIVAITSIWVRQPSPDLILSNVARTGLTAFFKTMAVQLASKNITANTVQPGLHLTERFTQLNRDGELQVERRVPSGKLGSPDDVGSIIAFLCSEQAGYITGVSIPVDGGLYSGLM